jgi:hypothetical protein
MPRLLNVVSSPRGERSASAQVADAYVAKEHTLMGPEPGQQARQAGMRRARALARGA